MKKPRIRPVIRTDFVQALWKCTGPNMFGNNIVGYGKTPAAAYNDWKLYFDFPF